MALISIYRVLAQSGIHPSTSHLDLHVRPAEIDLGEAALTPERLIEHVPIFAPLGEHGRSRLCDLVERRTFAPGEAVVKEGTLETRCSLLRAWSPSRSPRKDRKSEWRSRVSGPGEFFGEMALLTGDPRAATVVARDTTLTYEVTKAAIAPLMEGAQSLGAELSDAGRTSIGRRLPSETQSFVRRGEGRDQQGSVRSDSEFLRKSASISGEAVTDARGSPFGP